MLGFYVLSSLKQFHSRRPASSPLVSSSQPTLLHILLTCQSHHHVFSLSLPSSKIATDGDSRHNDLDRRYHLRWESAHMLSAVQCQYRYFPDRRHHSHFGLCFGVSVGLLSHFSRSYQLSAGSILKSTTVCRCVRAEWYIPNSA